jgi:hypothetical protein
MTLNLFDEIVFQVAMILRGPRRTVPHRMVEFRIDGVRAVLNAYDPDEIDLRVTATGPAGLTTAVPAFWCADREGVGWRMRFAPPLPGQWVLAAGEGTDRSAAVKLDVAAAEEKGFVRVAGSGFRFENGEPFVPIGPNLPTSQSAPDQALDDYRQWFEALSRDGCNATRLPMAPLGLEWTDTPLGDYTGRMPQAWLLDKVFELAARHGIQLMLTLLDHDQFGEDWPANPYNAALGGPLKTPGEFATHPEALRLFARRLRYIGARWAAHPALWAWEWWPAADRPAIGEDALAQWIRMMTPVLRAADPYAHPATTGLSGDLDAELDFASCRVGPAESAQTLPILAARERKKAAGRPVVIADFRGGDLPAALWTGIFSGFASAPMAWSPQALWWRHRGLAAFLRGERLANYTPVVPEASDGLTALALTSRTRALVWVRGTGAGAVSVPDLAAGPYHVTWYNTADGEPIAQETVVAADGDLRLHVPDLVTDTVTDIVVRAERPT